LQDFKRKNRGDDMMGSHRAICRCGINIIKVLHVFVLHVFLRVLALNSMHRTRSLISPLVLVWT
jgi:hypothetical protein